MIESVVPFSAAAAPDRVGVAMALPGSSSRASAGSAAAASPSVGVRADARRSTTFRCRGRSGGRVRIDDEVYAIVIAAPRVSLSEGQVDEVERLLELWKHGSQFSLVTGEPLQLPALKATPVYPVDVRSGDVVLTLP